MNKGMPTTENQDVATCDIKRFVSRHLKTIQTNESYQPISWYSECKNVISRLSANNGAFRNIYFYSKNSNVQPVVQEGPQCGLVALCMAGYMMQITVDFDRIFDSAKSLSYTLLGEMFSAEFMLILAKKILGCDGKIIQGSNVGEEIIQHLLKGEPVLIPYDKDHNHEPCLKNGCRAHWALLTGLLIKTKKKMHSITNGEVYQDTEIKNLFILTDLPDFIKNISNSNKDVEDIYVYAQQGKSLRTQLWSLDKFVKSNAQLNEIDPKVLENKSDYIIPEGGIKGGLKNKIVFLEKIR